MTDQEDTFDSLLNELLAEEEADSIEEKEDEDRTGLIKQSIRELEAEIDSLRDEIIGLEDELSKLREKAQKRKAKIPADARRADILKRMIYLPRK